VFHLADEHSVAKVQVGRSGVEACFYAQRSSEGQPFAQVFLANEFR
jgi:hypothetical protein